MNTLPAHAQAFAVYTTTYTSTGTCLLIINITAMFRSEVNQISRLQFCACADSPTLYRISKDSYKNEENRCERHIISQAKQGEYVKN